MDHHHHQPPASTNAQALRRGHASTPASRSDPFERHTRSDVDSWVEVSSQPSSSSLSSVGDDIVTTGLQVQADQRTRWRRANRPGPLPHLHITRTQSVGGTSSQEEYEESESESDRIMTSSGEGPMLAVHNSTIANTTHGAPGTQSSAGDEGLGQLSDDDDEDRTAINYPISSDTCFTPQPNAFSHPPSTQLRHARQPVPGSYFPSSRPPASRLSTRHSIPMTMERPQSHLPQNPLSPSFNAAAEHDEALRASLSGLLSVAAAARGLSNTDAKRPTRATPFPRSNRVDPSTLRLVPQSVLQNAPPPALQEPMFKPTIRRTSTNSTSTTSEQNEHKRKAVTTHGRNSSRERRAMKKACRSTANEDLYVTPTLLTWVVSAGVVVFLSALSFSAGYGIGKEAGRIEAGTFAADEQLRTCAREAGRSSLGLKRSLARSAIQV